MRVFLIIIIINIDFPFSMKLYYTLIHVFLQFYILFYHTFLFKNAYKKTKRLTSLYQPLCYGGAQGARTPDLLLVRQMLSQLS